MRLHADIGGAKVEFLAVHVACAKRRKRELPPPISIAYPPGARPGTIHIPKPMAWRPYENLIDGELDNRTPGKIRGWMRFFRNGQAPLRATFDLEGDFHEDIRGTVIRLSNPNPSDKYLEKGTTYMKGFDPMQKGTAGDITAGLTLGRWTQPLAQELMKRNELFWDEQDIQGIARETVRREYSERYREHIAAGDLYYPYVDSSQGEESGGAARRREETQCGFRFLFRQNG